MQNTGDDDTKGNLILESSKITGSTELHIPERGVHAEGCSHTSVVASEVSFTRSHGIHCVGKAVCDVQSSVVSGCQGEGITVLESTVTGNVERESSLQVTSCVMEQNGVTDGSGESSIVINR